MSARNRPSADAVITRLKRRIRALEAERVAADAVLSRLQAGILIVGRGGKVLLRNQSAQAILAARDGLVAVGDMIGAVQPTEATALRRLIAAAGAGVDSQQARAMQVRRRSGCRPYLVVVAPLGVPGSELATSGGPAAVVLIGDAECRVGKIDTVLRELYGLTPAEARIATLLARGERVAQVRTTLGITEFTARTHVKRILAKTGARGQMDLIRIILSGPAAVWMAALKHQSACWNVPSNT